MELEVVFHDEREFERWLRRTGGVNPGRIAGKVALVATQGGAIVGTPTVRSIGNGLHEIRVGVWRVYFVRRDGSLVILCAGSKDTQHRDIARARRRIR